MSARSDGPVALVMCIADASGNPRPNRVIHLLNQNGFTVDLFGFSLKKSLPIRQLYAISPPDTTLFQKAGRLSLTIFSSLLARTGLEHQAENFYLRRHRLNIKSSYFHESSYKLVVLEDLQLLPLAFRYWGEKSGTKIIFDAREFYPRQNEESLYFRWFEQPLRMLLCRKYLRRCSHLLTVSPGLARAYYKDFGVKMEILRSTPAFQCLKAKTTPADKVRMVHHGGANRNRGLSNMVEVVRRLGARFSLDFYLVGDERNIQSLKKQAEGCERIRFHEPVPFDHIISMLNGYDIGFFYVEPSTFNLYHCLPNKLFEFIQGRLAVAIGPSPDMAELINQYQCGFIAPEFSINAMVNTLAALTPEDIDRAKQNSARAAQELCYERESEKLMAALNAIMKV